MRYSCETISEEWDREESEVLIKMICTAVGDNERTHSPVTTMEPHLPSKKSHTCIGNFLK